MLEILLSFALACGGEFTSDYTSLPEEPKLSLEAKYEAPKAIVEEVEYVTVKARVTAYAPHDNKSGICNDGSPNSTSTGTIPKMGTLAVDPTLIPYGTKVEIPGYGIGTALDTGGALRRYDGYAIDVYFKTHEEAINWGVKYVEIKIFR